MRRIGLRPQPAPCVVWTLRSPRTILLLIAAAPLAAAVDPAAFLKKNCAGCHSGPAKMGNLDLTALAYPVSGTTKLDPPTVEKWVKVHDRLAAGEMPPKAIRQRPDVLETKAFLSSLSATLTAQQRLETAGEGRTTQRRLNGYEYENSLRDLLSAPWLQIKGQFPDDGEAFRFNKIGDALDVSHVHLARYLAAADYAIRQVISVPYATVPTTTRRYYARETPDITNKVNHWNQQGDRQVYPLLGLKGQRDVWAKTSPMTSPDTREQEAMGWVSSNYVTGFRYAWDSFHAPVPGRYRVKFSGYTIWAAPLPAPRSHLPNFEAVSPGQRDEAVNVYTRKGVLNRRVAGFDLTPTPAVHDIGEVWLLAGETLVPDASRLYRSRPNNFRNPLMTESGAPGVAFQWMEVEGPLRDETTTAGYQALFGDLPLKEKAPGKGLNATKFEVVSKDPSHDTERLLRQFLQKAYLRPVQEADVNRFAALATSQRTAGLSFIESMITAYTAILASPGYVYLREKPGLLDDFALAERLSLFLWNSRPDAVLRAHASKGDLHQSAVLKAETERLLHDPRSNRFIEAFLDYWLDLRKMEDSTASSTLYNDYYLDDALSEAALFESQLFFTEMLKQNLPARNVVASKFTFLNERLAVHYGIPAVHGVAMRRVDLPPDSVRGGFLTQASILKITANGTTTSPVMRGKWIMERILGYQIPQPPAVPAVEPDIRGAVTIRQQLEKHRSDPSCASCHNKLDPPGFALESFDIMGAWRDRYRGADENVPPVKGLGKNGQPFQFHYALPVDSTGKMPDGREFADIRDFKKLLLADEALLARNMATQLTVYATGAPVRFADRPEIARILAKTSPSGYGLHDIVAQVVQGTLFRSK